MMRALASALGVWLFSMIQSKAVDAATQPLLSVAAAREIVAQINRAEYAGWFDVADVLAVIEIESSFRPQVIGDDGKSFGLMQLTEGAARDRGYAGPLSGLLFNPELNIRIGMAHLKWSHDFLASRLSDKLTVAHWIGAYNAGVGNVLRGNIPHGYVARWLAARGRYQ